MYLSICERFGQDPTTFADRLDPWWWNHLGAYEAVRGKMGR